MQIKDCLFDGHLEDIEIEALVVFLLSLPLDFCNYICHSMLHTSSFCIHASLVFPRTRFLAKIQHVDIKEVPAC